MMKRFLGSVQIEQRSQGFALDTFRDTTLRLAVQALMLVRRGKKSVETLVSQVREMQDRLAQMERAYSTAQAEVQGTVLFGQYRV